MRKPRGRRSDAALQQPAPSPPACPGCEERDARIRWLEEILHRPAGCRCAYGPGITVHAYSCPVHGEEAGMRRGGG